jgi:CDGSH-type Zn-finger protein
MFGLYRGIRHGENPTQVQCDLPESLAWKNGKSSDAYSKPAFIMEIGGEFAKMSDPVIAQKSPYPVEVEAGKSYFWCACGKSANQPFCDGTHRGSGFAPVKFDATETKTVYFCGCKHTVHPVMCDGSHNNL